MFDGVVIAGLAHSVLVVAVADVVVAAVVIGETVVVDAESRVVLVVTGRRNVTGHLRHQQNGSQK